jgi:acetyltransferase-like isoleucine patch superfamily enzyme
MIIKKILKIMGKGFPSNKLRIFFFRLAGYKIGERVYIGEGLLISDKLNSKNYFEINDRVAISPRVTIITHSDPNNSFLTKIIPKKKGKVKICKDAWIGAGAIILPGITIGEASVVGSGAVVTKNVEPYSIVGGVPAKLIKMVRKK